MTTWDRQCLTWDRKFEQENLSSMEISCIQVKLDNWQETEGIPKLCIIAEVRPPHFRHDALPNKATLLHQKRWRLRNKQRKNGKKRYQTGGEAKDVRSSVGRLGGKAVVVEAPLFSRLADVETKYQVFSVMTGFS